MYQTIKYWRNPILELAGLTGPISCTSVVWESLYSLLYFIYFNWHNCKCGLNFSHFLLNLIKFLVQSLFGDIYWFLKNVSQYNIFIKQIILQYRYYRTALVLNYSNANHLNKLSVTTETELFTENLKNLSTSCFTSINILLGILSSWFRHAA